MLAHALTQRLYYTLCATTPIQMCSIALPCGHACPRHCHPGTDSDHNDVQCSELVEQTCPAGHKYYTSCAQATAAAAQAQRSPGAAAAVAAAATTLSCSHCQRLKKAQAAEAKRRAAQQQAQQEAANAAAVALAAAQQKVLNIVYAEALMPHLVSESCSNVLVVSSSTATIISSQLAVSAMIACCTMHRSSHSEDTTMLILIRVTSCNTLTVTAEQVAERQRELEHARELVKFEHAVQEHELAAETLRCEAQVQRTVAADLRSAALERVRAAARSAAAAAASDQARHLSDLETRRHDSSSNSGTAIEGSASSSKPVANAPLAVTAPPAAAAVPVLAAAPAAKAVVAVHNEQSNAALTDLLDALTAAGRTSDVSAMCSAFSAVPAAARSSVAAALVPLLGELAVDLMATASTANAAQQRVAPTLSASLEAALKLHTGGQLVKAHTALTAAVADSSSSSDGGAAVYALVLCNVQAGGALSSSDYAALLQRLQAADTRIQAHTTTNSSNGASPLRSLAYAAVHAAAPNDCAAAHLGCAAALHFLLLPAAISDAHCGGTDCWRTAASDIAARTGPAMAAKLSGTAVVPDSDATSVRAARTLPKLSSLSSSGADCRPSTAYRVLQWTSC
eukprot:18682-Heterococcus_DN1.PRE.2